MPEVHLTRRALRDLEEIDAFSTARLGDADAAAYLADLFSAAERLGEEPRLLQRRDDTSLRLRFHPARDHLLICDLLGGHIYILAVLHAATDLQHRIADLEPQLIFEADLLARQIESDA